MKIKVWWNSGANIHSGVEETLDLEKDLGITPDDWQRMTDEEKFKEVEDYAYTNGMEVGWTDEES